MKRLLAFVLALILMFSFAFSVSAAKFPDLKVSLAADNNSVDVGQEVKVTLSFENASAYPYGLAAFCAYLTYDPGVLRVKSINAAVPRSSIRHNSMEGELRSVYLFASAQKQPGFNTDDAFYTVTFETLNSGSSSVSVTFDAITVTDYDSDELNFNIAFNSPSISINVKGDEPESKVESVSGTTSTETTTSSNVSSSATTSSNVSSAKPVEPSNKDFEDVANSGKDTVQDVFDESGEIIEQTESKAPQNTTSSNVTQAGKDDVYQGETNGIPNVIIWVGLGVLVVAVIAVVAVFIIKKKK